MKQLLLCFGILFTSLNFFISCKGSKVNVSKTEQLNILQNNIPNDSVYVIEIGIRTVEKLGAERDTISGFELQLLNELIGYTFMRTIVYDNYKTAVLSYDSNFDVSEKVVYNSLDTSLTIIKYSSNAVSDSTKESMKEVFSKEVLDRTREKIIRDGIYTEKREVRKNIFGLDAYQVKFSKALYKDYQNFKLYLTDDIPFVNNEKGNMLKIKMQMVLETRVAGNGFLYTIGAISRKVDLSKKHLLQLEE